MILAGDTGGTKTRLALFEFENERMLRKDMETFVSREYSGLVEVLQIFLNNRSISIEKACLGVPGPVINGEAQITNLPWKLSEAQIRQSMLVEKFRLVNDLVATTAAVPYLDSNKLLVLHQGKKAKDHHKICAVLAPGTGLGQAFLSWDADKPQAHASEGGHVDLAPTSELEIELLKYLKTRFKRVSYERVLSGPGLVNIYAFLKYINYAPVPPELNARLNEEDPAAVIAMSGQTGEYEICVKALDIFASLLGAQAGNLVLSLLATGGIYLGGGIPPRISKKLSDGTTVKAYLDKGRLSNIVEETPLYIIKDDHAALLGAAYLAKQLT